MHVSTELIKSERDKKNLSDQKMNQQKTLFEKQAEITQLRLQIQEAEKKKS